MRIRSFLLVLAIVLAACSEADEAVIGSSSDGESTETSDAAGDGAKEDDGNEEEDDSNEEETEAKEADNADLTAEVGFTSGVDSIDTRHTSVGALVTNPNTDAAYDVTIVFNLMGPNGILDTQSETIPYVPGEATIPVAPLQIGFDLAEEPTSVEYDITGTFAADEGWDGVDFMMGKGIDLTVTDPVITPGDYGTTLAFNATNPGDAIAEYASWNCVFRSGATIVGGESSSITDPVVPDGTVRVESSLSIDEIAADEIICRSYA